MSDCIDNCRLCKNLVLSQAVTFADNTLTIDLPTRNYGNGCKYCIVVAQAIPDTTTIIAPVVFTINGGTTTYPFLNRDCTPVYASQLRTRKVYPTRVNTGISTGVFKYVGSYALPCSTVEVDASIPVADATTP